jgi:transcriptional regulator with XRE-family HTH domain
MSESSGSNTSFADRLKAARERREMTQADLARKTGMQPSAIAHFEGNRRKPSFDNIRALSQALDVTSDYLMGAGEQATAFRNEGKLSDKDREYIQDIINVMVKKKEGE